MPVAGVAGGTGGAAAPGGLAGHLDGFVRAVRDAGIKLD